MEKSPIEKALEMFPSKKEMWEEAGMPGSDIPDIYRKLKSVESAYEYLQQAGLDVGAQLRERRYQIAEMVSEMLLNDVENLHRMITSRAVDKGGLGDFFTNLSSGSYIPKLEEYLRKICPELDEATANVPKQEDYFPEK